MPALVARVTNPNREDKELAQHFSSCIREGHPIATAAVLSGIGERTARRYLADGTAEAELEQGSPSLFWRMFKEAEAWFVADNLDRIHRDAKKPGGWAASMTLLERRRPKDFGRNVQVETTATVTHVHELGPAAQRAIASHMLREVPEESHGGSDSDATPLLPEGRESS